MKGPTDCLLFRRVTRCAPVMFEAGSACDVDALLAFPELAAAELATPSSAMIGIGRLLPLRFFVIPLVCDMGRKGRLVLTVCAFSRMVSEDVESFSIWAGLARCAGDRLLALLVSSCGRKGSCSGKVIVLSSMLLCILRVHLRLLGSFWGRSVRLRRRCRAARLSGA